MTRKTAAVFWPVVSILAIFALGFAVALGMRPRPATVEVVTRAGPSAAMSITGCLFGLLGVMALAVIGVVVASVVLRAQQQARRMEQAALLFNARQPQPAAPRRQVGAGEGPSIIVVSGGGQMPRVEDLRDGYR